MPANTSQVTDKHNEPIHIGDVVSAKARGGKHAGKVTDIVMTAEEAHGIEGTNVKNPPKVIFKDQHGHTVSHNPETLVHGDDPRK